MRLYLKKTLKAKGLTMAQMVEDLLSKFETLYASLNARNKKE
jgi:hypothetical protein